MELRQYQKDSVKAIMDTIESIDGNPILQLPTGSGKSLILAELSRQMQARWQNIKILVLTHRAKLVEQDADKFAKVGLIPSIYCAELHRKEIGQFTLGTILSVAHHSQEFRDFHLIICDECQMINNENEGAYRKFLDSIPDVKVIGLSATPFRLKGGACYGKGRIFNRVAYKIGFSDLVKQGYLTPPINYDANANDTFDDIKITAGEFNTKDMNAHFNKIVWKSCEDLVKRMRNRNYVLVFACSIIHANAIVDTLTKMGEKAKVYHSELSLVEDRIVIQSFENKEFKYLVSIDKLGVGFDAPFVDGLALMRPTMSRALAIQQLGRGSRLYEGKQNFLVADYAGNIKRHNLLYPDDYDVPYEQIQKPKRTGGVAPTKVCPECQEICATRTTVCRCGYKFPPKVSVVADMSKGTDVIPIQIWYATAQHNVKHNYCDLIVGSVSGAKHIFFFPEDKGFAKMKSYMYWNKLFGTIMPDTVEEALADLNAMRGDYSGVAFSKKGAYWEIRELIANGVEDERTDNTTLQENVYN